MGLGIDSRVVVAVAFGGVLGCGAVVEVRPDAEHVTYMVASVDEPESEVLGEMEQAGCRIVASGLVGRSSSSDPEVAACGARNDVRNQAHDMGANTIVLAPRRAWTLEGDEVVVRGTAVRCPTAEEQGVEVYVSAVRVEARCEE